jgi:hypothetical protein
MLEPRVAMTTLHSATTRVGDLPKRQAIPWSNGANVLLRERPAWLDRVQVGRVRRQELDASTARLDNRYEAWVLVSGRVVEDDDIAAS